MSTKEDMDLFETRADVLAKAAGRRPTLEGTPGYVKIWWELPDTAIVYRLTYIRGRAALEVRVVQGVYLVESVYYYLRQESDGS